MKIEEVLENLVVLLNGWGISLEDWILVSQYAYRLLGYEVKVREGHLNILIDRGKIPWEVGEALETHPPENTKESEQFQQFVEITGFEFDISPVAPKDFKEKIKNTVLYSLPNGTKIRVQTPIGALEELDQILSKCTADGWGEEKGARILPSVEDQRKAILKKGEKELAEAYGNLIQKYSHLEKAEISKKPEGEAGEISGIPASPGKATGTARVILDPENVKKFQKGDILVTEMTSPKFTPFIGKAAAIVTDEGGTLCHAAIVSREYGIPAVVGTRNATKVLKDGDLVEVDAESGVVRKLE